jgi:serine/threonine protein kinase
VEHKYFPEASARKIFYDIVGAVRYMHENNFMHRYTSHYLRDLKPENIMYDQTSSALKIVDLGSAIEFNSSDCEERKRVGTSYYIAPEVLVRFYN